MSYTLGEASRATGKNKTTIARAIHTGKLSATRNSDGSYTIDPAELHRVFPVTPGYRAATVAPQQNATEDATPVALAVLEERVAQLEQRLAEVETQRDQWHDQAERLTRLLMAPKADEGATPAPVAQPAEPPAEQPPARPWWKRW